MNKRLFTVLSAVSVLALAACTSSTGTGTGGSTGSGGDATTSGETVGNTTGGGGDMTTGSGGAGGGACVTCGEAITNDTDPFCDQEAADLYDALAACVCMTACTPDCDAYCADPENVAPDAACQACLGDAAGIQMACPNEVMACVNDT